MSAPPEPTDDDRQPVWPEGVEPDPVPEWRDNRRPLRYGDPIEFGGGLRPGWTR